MIPVFIDAQKRNLSGAAGRSTPRTSGPPPLFIVGAPRSGTTLLAAIMNAHGRFCCGNETHCFEGLRGGVVDLLVQPDRWPARAFDYMQRLRHVGRSIFEWYGIDRKEFLYELARSRPSVGTVLSTFMALYARGTGKFRWAEKTPGHLKRFQMIRQHYPDSPILCSFRDPRDVALSIMSAPWGASTFADGLLVWRSYFSYYERFAKSDLGVLTITFEQFVTSPHELCDRICRFVGERFDPEMLETSRTAAAVGCTVEPYKGKAATAPDSTRAFAWRNRLSGREVALAESMLGEQLDRLAYPRT